jgi:hypothetical protein
MKLSTIAIFLLISLYSSGQNSNITFQRYNITNVGYIDIPSTMELQVGEYKKNQEKFLEKSGFTISNNRGVFQQKGLNNHEEAANKLYARVIIETFTGNYGDFKKITKDRVYSSHDILLLDNDFKLQTKQSFINTQNKIISWYGTSAITVNDVSGIKISYLRQLGDMPPVIVNNYKFENNNLLHSITMSYRAEEKKIWESVYLKIIDSFTITNIK